MYKNNLALILLVLSTAQASDCYKLLYQENHLFKIFEDIKSSIYLLNISSSIEKLTYKENELFKALIDLRTQGKNLITIVECTQSDLYKPMNDLYKECSPLDVEFNE